MTMPPAHDPWEQELSPVDPQTLPPGFYFPPGQEPKPQADGLSRTVKIALSAAVVVLVVVVVVVVLMLSGGSGDDGALGVVSPWAASSFAAVAST